MVMHKKRNKPIIITAGEPAGIGPELAILLAQKTKDKNLVICADKNMLVERAKMAGIELFINEYDKTYFESEPKLPDDNLGSELHNNEVVEITVLHVPLTEPSIAGQLNKSNGQYVLNTLIRATEGCLSGEFSALLTAPVHKGIINEAGVAFTGHTEFLAQMSDVQQVVMVLATDKMKVGLATTHLPLKDVSNAITQESLTDVIRIIHQELTIKYKKRSPKIYVCGLNPHAGEGGHLGMEEIDVIIPVIEKLNAAGMNLIGPMPADTVFQPKYLDDADLILAMYHDQGLPVLKYQGFGEAVNITFGLPFIRVSVDHGTAIDLAGSFKADVGSIMTAYHVIKSLMTDA